MTYNFIYDENYKLTFRAVIIDARAGTPLARKNGTIINDFVNQEIDKVVEGVITYKIETNLGNLAGYITLKKTNMGNSAVVLQQLLRPAYQQFTNDISQGIQNLLISGDWKFDTL